jgi:hypothetical protein
MTCPPGSNVFLSDQHGLAAMLPAPHNICYHRSAQPLYLDFEMACHLR